MYFLMRVEFLLYRHQTSKDICIVENVGELPYPMWQAEHPPWDKVHCTAEFYIEVDAE